MSGISLTLTAVFGHNPQGDSIGDLGPHGHLSTSDEDIIAVLR